MQTISKTGLKIIDVELMDFEVNPEFTIEDVAHDNCQWSYFLDCYREDAIVHHREYDQLRIETRVIFLNPEEKEIFHIHVDTKYQTKHLKVEHVTDMFWIYISETAFRHCMALARYKTVGILPENTNFITLSMNDRTDTKQKINEIWG